LLKARGRLIFRNKQKKKPLSMPVLVEIQESLAKFRVDYPDPTKVAFVMMRLIDGPPHERIVDAIKGGLEPHGIKAVRADEKEYHPDLLSNILT
jgi:hypothetical protein